jgi:excisionase family DNA binding protein
VEVRKEPELIGWCFQTIFKLAAKSRSVTEQYLGLEEASFLEGIPEQDIRRSIAHGKLPAAIDKDVFQAWVKRRYQGDTPQPPPEDRPPPTLTAKEVAKKLRCGRTTVYDLVQAGKLRSYRVGSGNKQPGIRIYAESVEEYLQAQGDPPTEPAPSLLPTEKKARGKSKRRSIKTKCYEEDFPVDY